ncbi:Eco29kI family restriction endonuclease [Dickeya oryzae]|uniref:Eco29kI family restriction endonuclease n=1 Tax=Dickeya oryzae TaxID=1240404 RepID=UPI001AECEE86|nr:Eco29kI family restriction endonuclease [Dickeya oryzae]MBP2845083.1 Eco29kI family restriction endonuclease [Dickeya oryzae]
MTGNIVPFNPLDKQNLGASVAEALLNTYVHPLAELATFSGAGIYAIYYTGNHPAYEQLANLNRDGKFLLPIYVGKAVPPGARMGLTNPDVVGNVLFRRLKEHADSLRAATNLNIEDFYCRFLVVDDIWIPLGESLVISRFKPIWNSSIDGFGNHDPGRHRYTGLRPRWDFMHPGRAWAQNLRERDETVEELIRDAQQYLQYLPICLARRD